MKVITENVYTLLLASSGEVIHVQNYSCIKFFHVIREPRVSLERSHAKGFVKAHENEKAY